MRLAAQLIDAIYFAVGRRGRHCQLAENSFRFSLRFFQMNAHFDAFIISN